MFKEDAIDYVEQLFSNTLFRRFFLEFFARMQQEGIQAAKGVWNLYHDSDDFIPKAPELFEKLVDFYIILGFVPRQRHESVLGENEKLKEQAQLLMDTMKELQSSLYENGGKDLQEVWQAVINRQIETNRYGGNGLHDFFNQIKGSGNAV